MALVVQGSLCRDCLCTFCRCTEWGLSGSLLSRMGSWTLEDTTTFLPRSLARQIGSHGYHCSFGLCHFFTRAHSRTITKLTTVHYCSIMSCFVAMIKFELGIWIVGTIMMRLGTMSKIVHDWICTQFSYLWPCHVPRLCKQSIEEPGYTRGDFRLCI